MFGTRLLTAIADSIPLTEKYLSLNFKLKRFLRGQDLPALYRHAVWMGSFAVIDFKDLFNQVVYNHIKNVPVFDVIEAYVTAPQLTSEQKLFLFYLRVYLMDGVLVKVDRASMLNGLEVRAPFLDYKLVAWASGLPHQYKMKGLTTKYILKKLMENKVPRDIVWRKKQGFAMPLARWLRHDLREWGDELLSPARLKQQGMYDVGTVTRLWNEHQNGRADHHRELWNLLVFQSWYSTWGS
jgi:asparagine synthase (glutamine-hydrolysing)